MFEVVRQNGVQPLIVELSLKICEPSQIDYVWYRSLIESDNFAFRDAV